MKTPVIFFTTLAFVFVIRIPAQVLPSGGGGQAQPSNVDNSPKPQQQKAKPVLGDALPFFDPGSETVQWDGKMFSVTNNRVFRAMLETYLAAPTADSADDQAYRDVIEKINHYRVFFTRLI